MIKKEDFPYERGSYFGFLHGRALKFGVSFPSYSFYRSKVAYFSP